MADYLDISGLPQHHLTFSRVPDVAFNAAIATFEGMVFYGGGAYPDTTLEGNFWWCGGKMPENTSTYGLGPMARCNPPAMARLMSAFMVRHAGAPAEALYRQMCSEHVPMDPDGWARLSGAMKIPYLVFVAMVERLTPLAVADPEPVPAGPRATMISPAQGAAIVREAEQRAGLVTPIHGGRKHGKKPA